MTPTKLVGSIKAGWTEPRLPDVDEVCDSNTSKPYIMQDMPLWLIYTLTALLLVVPVFLYFAVVYYIYFGLDWDYGHRSWSLLLQSLAALAGIPLSGVIAALVIRSGQLNAQRKKLRSAPDADAPSPS